MARSESLIYLSLVVIFGVASVTISSSLSTGRTLGVVGPAGFRLAAIFLAAIITFFVFSNRQHIWNFLEEGITNKRLLLIFLIPILFALVVAPFYRRLPLQAGFPLGDLDSTTPPRTPAVSVSEGREAIARAEQVLQVIREVPEQAVSYAFLLPVLLVGSLIALWYWRNRHARKYIGRRRDILELARTSLAEAVERLERYDNVRQTIMACYKRMCSNLASYGYPILPQHTAKEFEFIVGSALPLPRDDLQRLTNLFEEARYSEHSLGDENRHEALQNLRAIQSSLASGQSG